jgi:hypothetical protein
VRISESNPTDAGVTTPAGAVATLGASCSSAGSLACAGNAQKLLLLCDGSKWVSNGVCAGDQICDTRPGPTAGSCQAPLAECKGRKPSETVCNGAERVTCGPDLITATRETCRSAKHCAASTGATCAPCFNGQTFCEGAVLMSCAPDGTSKVLETCATEALCLDLEPKCFPPACAIGEVRCTGDRLEKCRADRGDFELVKVCLAGGCSAAMGACTTEPACAPNEYRCVGDELQVCNADLTAFDALAACDPGKCDAAAKACKPASTTCTSGEKGCVGNKTAICGTSGDWVVGSECGGTTPTCSAGVCVASGACTAGAFRCTGYEILEKCASSGAGWEVYKKCLPAFCDAVGGECDDCKVGEKSCAGATPRKCDPTGHWTYAPPCMTACVAGECSPG